MKKKNKKKNEENEYSPSHFFIFYFLFLLCCFTPTETIKNIRDGEPRTATSTFTLLLNYEHTRRTNEDCIMRSRRNTSENRPNIETFHGREPLYFHTFVLALSVPMELAVNDDNPNSNTSENRPTVETLNDLEVVSFYF